MLKNIDPVLTGELLSILADMGHGDEIVIVDANFPAATYARRLVRLPGLDADRVAKAILSIMPLDDFVDTPALAMTSPNGRPEILDAFEAAMAENGEAKEVSVLDRFAFYDRARQAFAIVATGERRLYGNLILKKGVVR